MEDYYLAIALSIAAAVSYLIRLLPFVALGKVATAPWLHFLGKYLPAMIMLLLVVYSLKGLRPWLASGNELSLNFAANGLPLIIASLATVLLHWWRANALLSIIGGTGLYMLLIQAVWPT